MSRKLTINAAANQVRLKKSGRKSGKCTPHPTLLAKSKNFLEGSSVAVLDRPQVRRERMAIDRAHLCVDRFDCEAYRVDVLIYKRIKPLLDELRIAVEEEAEVKSSPLLGPLYQMARAISVVPDTDQWQECPKCNATGFLDGRKCSLCSGAMYRIPGI